jgi:uncharacterized phage protein (TIGR01671 family)
MSSKIIIPKFRFYAIDEFKGLYPVVEIRFDEEILVVEDCHNTSMMEAIDEDYNLSKNGNPTFCYGFDEGIITWSDGILDMDSNDIYIGDIVSVFYRCDEKEKVSEYQISEVELVNGQFQVYLSESNFGQYHSLSDQCPNYCKKIGNIFENSELLGNR